MFGYIADLRGKTQGAVFSMAFEATVRFSERR